MPDEERAEPPFIQLAGSGYSPGMRVRLPHGDQREPSGAQQDG